MGCGSCTRNSRMIARCVALSAALALVLHGAPARADGAVAAPHLPGANEAQLPDAPPLIGPLRRGADGKIVPVTPEEERKAGRPLCAAGAKCVGRGEAFPTLAAALADARPGDTIDIIGGIYREAVVIAVPHLTLRGTAGRPHFDCAGIALAGGKACITVAAGGVTLDNLEISGAAASPGAAGGGAACLRSDGDLDLALADIFCHASQSGLIAAGGKLVISHSEFFDNGSGGDGRNIDLGSDCVSVTVSGSIFRDSAHGDEFTSRCARTEISDSTFRSMRGARALHFPLGGETLLYRSTIETSGAHDKEIIAFADQACLHRGSLRLKQVQIENSRYDAMIVNADKCAGDPITVEQVGVEGLPVSVQGFFVNMGGSNLRGIGARSGAGQRAAPSPGR